MDPHPASRFMGQPFTQQCIIKLQRFSVAIFLIVEAKPDFNISVVDWGYIFYVKVELNAV